MAGRRSKRPTRRPSEHAPPRRGQGALPAGGAGDAELGFDPEDPPIRIAAAHAPGRRRPGGAVNVCGVGGRMPRGRLSLPALAYRSRPATRLERVGQVDAAGRSEERRNCHRGRKVRRRRRPRGPRQLSPSGPTSSRPAGSSCSSRPTASAQQLRPARRAVQFLGEQPASPAARPSQRQPPPVGDRTVRSASRSGRPHRRPTSATTISHLRRVWTPG